MTAYSLLTDFNENGFSIFLNIHLYNVYVQVQEMPSSLLRTKSNCYETSIYTDLANRGT